MGDSREAQEKRVSDNDLKRPLESAPRPNTEPAGSSSACAPLIGSRGPHVFNDTAPNSRSRLCPARLAAFQRPREKNSGLACLHFDGFAWREPSKLDPLPTATKAERSTRPLMAVLIGASNCPEDARVNQPARCAFVLARESGPSGRRRFLSLSLLERGRRLRGNRSQTHCCAHNNKLAA